MMKTAKITMRDNPLKQLVHISKPVLWITLLIASTSCLAQPFPTPVSTITPVPAESIPSTIIPSETPTNTLPSVSEIVSRVKPSVVSIAVRTLAEECDFFFGCRTVEQDGAGTGVIFSSDGHIVTNNHVVAEADEITVILHDERTFTANIVGRDPASDLAVIKIPGSDYRSMEFSDPDALRVGDWVIAIGNALALVGGPTVTMGIVGAVNRSIDTSGARLFDMIQTDAAINPGNSGGPLVNLAGELVGINTARDAMGEGIGFAVSSFTVKPVVESIVRDGRVIFAWLGVGVRDVTPIIAAQENLSVSRGILVVGTDPYGPASQSGILHGDVIKSLDGVEVGDIKQLQKVIRTYEVGAEVNVGIIRGTNQHSYEVTLEEQPRGS